MKRLSFFVLILVLMTSVCLNRVYAAGNQNCYEYSGSNVNAQNYDTWSRPVYSYIVPDGDDGFMNFEYINGADGMLAEYYSEDYTLKNTVTIPYELPAFGGFYAVGDNYYVLTGQENPNEGVSVEVFRITKYDKSWKRIASVGVKNCNTTVPFDAGSARFAHCGKYIIIRTSHEMYKSSDGLNHQANLTMQLNTETMQIISSQTSVSNNKYGYVSHSFNQFLHVENNALLALDHGDALPRSIAFFKYAGDVSDGDFTQTYRDVCTVVDMLPIAGEIGDNYTGCSVGGFEYSDTSYITAGSSVPQNTAKKQKTRNVFVSSVPKNSLTDSSVNIAYLTNYEEGDEGASTPHLVKISDNRFVILWSRLGKVYYAQLDAEGKLTGSVHKFKGELSDCAPVVMNGKLMWYTRGDSAKTFYEIQLDDISDTSVYTVKSGHDYELLSENVFKCKKCSVIITLTLPEYVYGMWENTQQQGSYSTIQESSYHPGSTVRFITGYIGGADIGCELRVASSDESVISVNYNPQEGSGVLTFHKQGEATVTVESAFDSSINRKTVFQIQHSFSQWETTVEPGCTRGEKERVCSVCGYRETKALEATGHSFTDYASNNDATCQKDGTKTAKCDNCQQKNTVADKGSKKSHVFISYISNNDATCQKDGTKTAKCDNCEQKNTVTENGSKKAHSFKTYVSDKNATYSANGTKTSTCSSCKKATKTVTDEGSKLTLGVVSSLKASESKNSVTLSWKKVSGATGYRVYKYNGGWKTVKNIEGTSYTVKNLEAGTNYRFAVKAYVKQAGKTVFAPKYVSIKTATKPLPPSILKASSQKASSITLQWSACEGASGYKVYRYDSTKKKWSTVVSSTTKTKYTVKNLSTGKSYKFAVKPFIKTASGTVWADTYTSLTTHTAPATPKIKLASTAKGRVTISWNNVSGETGYQIWYSTKPTSGFKKLGNYPADTVKVYKKGFKSSKTYYFRVRAYKKSGASYLYSSYSPTVKVIIK